MSIITVLINIAENHSHDNDGSHLGVASNMNVNRTRSSSVYLRIVPVIMFSQCL